MATPNPTKSLDDLPQAPGTLPGLGHALPLLRDHLGFMAGLSAHGPLVTIRLGPARAVVVCDPALVRHVLLNDRILDKGGVLWDLVRDVTGNGLASCPH